MYWDELDEKLYILGNDEEVLVWKEWKKLGWVNDDEFQEAVDSIYEERMVENGLDPLYDKPVFPFATKRDWPGNHEISLGHALNGIEVGLNIGDLKRGGLGIMGFSGAGKTICLTNIIRQLMSYERVHVWLLETSKTIFRNLLSGTNVLTILSTLFQWNRWSGPREMNPITYHSLLVDTIADSHGMLAKGRAMLQHIVDELDSQFGIDKGSPHMWTDLSVLQKMIEYQRKTNSREEKDTLAKWIIRFAPYEKYAKRFGAERSFDLAKLMNQNVIWELTDFPRGIQSDITASLCLWRSLYKRQNPDSTETTGVIVIDEAMNLVAEDNIKLTDSFLPRLLKSGRESSEFIIYGEQQAKSLKDILDLSFGTIIMQQTDFGIPFFIRYHPMRERANYLKNLPVGNGVVCMPEKPNVEIKIPLREITRRRTDQEIETEMAPILEQFLIEALRAEYASATRTHTEGDIHHQRKTEQDITPDEEKAQKAMLRTIAEDPLIGTQELIERNNLSTDYGERMLHLLLNVKFLEGPVEVPTGGRPKKVYVLGYKGAVFAGLDYSRVRLKGKGGPVSKTYAKIVHDWLEKQDKAVAYEHTLTVGKLKKQADVADLNNGKPIAYEIESAENPHSQVVRNIELNHRVGFTKTVVVTKDRSTRHKVETYLMKTLPPDIWKRVEIQTIREFL